MRRQVAADAKQNQLRHALFSVQIESDANELRTGGHFSFYLTLPQCVSMWKSLRRFTMGKRREYKKTI